MVYREFRRQETCSIELHFSSAEFDSVNGAYDDQASLQGRQYVPELHY